MKHEWFGVEANDEVLDDAIEGFKDLQENDTPVNNMSEVSNPLLTVTPVMAGRKLKDTCESPWNPSGTTPKMAPATPMLRDGFEGNHKRVNLPGILGNQNQKKEETKKKKNGDFDTFKKFDDMQANRKTKTPQGTVNFGDAIGNKLAHKAEETKKEINKEFHANIPTLPQNMNKKESNDSVKKGAILDKILESTHKQGEENKVKEKIGLTPETKPQVSHIVLNVSDSIVNIDDEMLRECPDDSIKPSMNRYQFLSFKPGVPKDKRVMPITPGENQESMSTKNKPHKIKNSLLKAI